MFCNKINPRCALVASKRQPRVFLRFDTGKMDFAKGALGINDAAHSAMFCMIVGSIAHRPYA